MGMSRSVPTKRYHVLLMPNDDYMVREDVDTILSTERQAIDSWEVDATGKNHALGIVLHKLYHQLQEAATNEQRIMRSRLNRPLDYVDPNAQSLHDAVKQAVGKGWTLEYFMQAVEEAKQAIARHNSAVSMTCMCNGLHSCDERQRLHRHLDLMRYRRDYIKEHGSTAGMLTS